MHLSSLMCLNVGTCLMDTEPLSSESPVFLFDCVVENVVEIVFESAQSVDEC